MRTHILIMVFKELVLYFVANSGLSQRPELRKIMEKNEIALDDTAVVTSRVGESICWGGSRSSIFSKAQKQIASNNRFCLSTLH